MEVKKSPKADLEKGKTMGILMGMIVGLAVLFVGFEWSDREITIVQDQGVADIIAEEEVEITRLLPLHRHLPHLLWQKY
jgi:protein TonB